MVSEFIAYSDEKYVLIIEAVILLLMLVDTILRMLAAGMYRFFAQRWNLIDLVLIILSLTSLAIYLRNYYYSLFGQLQDFAILSIMLFRNFTQFLRIVVLIKNHNSIKKSVHQHSSVSRFLSTNTKFEIVRMDDSCISGKPSASKASDYLDEMEKNEGGVADFKSLDMVKV